MDELLNKIKQIILFARLDINDKDKKSFVLLSNYLKENKELIHFENSIYDAENEILFKNTSNSILCYLLSRKDAIENMKNVIDTYNEEIEGIIIKYNEEIEGIIIKRDRDIKLLKRIINKTSYKNIEFDSKGWEIPKGKI